MNKGEIILQDRHMSRLKGFNRLRSQKFLSVVAISFFMTYGAWHRPLSAAIQESCTDPTLRWVIDPANIIVECDSYLGGRDVKWIRLWLRARCAPGPDCNPPKACRLDIDRYPSLARQIGVSEVEAILRDGFDIANLECRTGLFGAPWCEAVVTDRQGRNLSDLLWESGMFCAFLP